MSNKNALVILAKWPEIGKTKSRIASETSQEFALNFSNACMKDLVKNLLGSKKYKILVGTDTEEELGKFMHEYDLEGLTLKSKSPQWKDSLSEKINFLFEKLLRIYEKVILIPMDLPFLSEEVISEALDKLENNDFVIGPEHNGGVYLIGMKRFNKHLFRNVAWSTKIACKGLVKNFNDHGECVLLLERDDLNTLQDVFRNYNEVVSKCENLHRLMKKNLADLRRRKDIKMEFELK